MRNKHLLFVLLLSILSQISFSQVSPWGTGSITNQLIGNLEDTTVVFEAESGYGNYGWFPNPNTLLPTYTYDIYIPPSYDGTEPYGLVTFVNSSNNGGVISQWQTVLDEKKLIYVAGDNIGNPIDVEIRCGVAMAAVYRLNEILNIDSTRVYTSGNSGGARTGAILALIYPEWFFGYLTNCGSSYLRQVDQDYETYQEDSHYEYGLLPFTISDLEYTQSFERNYAILTSFDDFREGDIMNIYYNGMEPDGYRAKVLETSGPHCSTTAEHFRDAVNFVEHPHIDIIRDSFGATPEVGNGFKTIDAIIESEQLILKHDVYNTSRAYSKNPFLWNDDKGAIIRTSVELDSISYKKNSFFNMGLLDFSDTNVYHQNVGHELYPSKANLLLSILFNDDQPTVLALAENPDGGVSNDTLFNGVFSDWSSNEALTIKYHIWNQEVRIEFDKHFNPNPEEDAMARLLDDNRSIRIRTDANYWNHTDFQKGTMLTFVSGKIDTLSVSTSLQINHIEVIVADTLENISLNISEKNYDHPKSSFIAFPNPSTGHFEIVSKNKENINFNIYNNQGKKVGTHIHRGNTSSLNLTNKKTGIYYLINEDKQRIKLVIQ